MASKPATKSGEVIEQPVGKAEKSRRKRAVLPFTPEQPPKVMDGHVQEIAGARRGAWRQANADPLRTYADSGQINEDQFEAGKWYEEKFWQREKTGHTKFERASPSSDPDPLTLEQEKAIVQILAVDTRLSQENYVIIRRVCGLGHHASEAVKDATGESSRHFPIPRFREALNALRNAILSAKKDGWKATLERVA